MPHTNKAANKKALTALFMVVFIDLLGFGMVIPLLPQIGDAFASEQTARHVAGLMGGEHPPQWWLNLCLYFLANKGTTTGWLLGLFSLMQFLFSPLWGSLSDKWGRKPLLTWGMAGHAVGHGLFAVSTGMGVMALPWMYVSRIITGFAGANLPVAMAYIADHTEAEDRARGMGLIGAAFGLGFIVGPAVSGILAGKFGWAAPFWLASGVSLCSGIFAQFVLVESDASVRQQFAAARQNRWVLLQQAWTTPGLKGALLLFFIVMFGFANLEISFVLFGRQKLGLDEAHVGYLLGFAGLTIAFTQGFALGRLRKRFSEVTLIRAGMFFMMAALIIIPLSESLVDWGRFLNVAPWWLLLILPGIFMVAFGNGITNPSLAGFVSRKTPAETQGGMLGASQSLSSLARVVGPIVAGNVFDHVGHQKTFLVGAFIMLIGLVVGFALLSDKEPVQTDAALRAES